MFSKIKEMSNSVVQGVSSVGESIKDTAIETSDSVVDGVSSAGTSIKNTAIETSDSVVDGISNIGGSIMDTTYLAIDTTIDYSALTVDGIATMNNALFDETKKASLYVYSSASEISTNTKEHIFSFLEDNKKVISNKLEEKFSEKIDDVFDDIVADMILSFIHGLMPFPFNYIIPESVFVAFGKANIIQIKKILT